MVKGWTKYYPGVVSRVNSDGTYDINFDDGDKKKGVTRRQMKSLEVDSRAREREASPRSDFRVLDKVNARRSRNDNFEPAEITAIHADGTFDVRFEDGTRVKDLPTNHIRKSVARERQRTKSNYDVGEAVEARFRGSNKYYPGRVSRKNRDGTFGVEFNDGTSDMRVRHSDMREARQRSRPVRQRAAEV